MNFLLIFAFLQIANPVVMQINQPPVDLSTMTSAQLNLAVTQGPAVTLDVTVSDQRENSFRWVHNLNSDELVLWNSNQAIAIERSYAAAFKLLLVKFPLVAPPQPMTVSIVSPPVAGDAKQWLANLLMQITSLQSLISVTETSISMEKGDQLASDLATLASQQAQLAGLQAQLP